MNNPIQTKIEDHSLVPVFDLPAAGGQRVMTWNYKGRKNLVILFVLSILDELQEQLKALVNQYSEFQERNAEIIVVSQDNIEALNQLSKELGLPFPLVSDVDGSVTDKYTSTGSAAFVIDRYGELYAQSTPADEGPLDYEQMLDWLQLIELQCPECGVSTWI
jgi:peroxiredoxin